MEALRIIYNSEDVAITYEMLSDLKRKLLQYLEEDLRLDMDELANFDVKIIESCAAQGGKKTILDNLIKIIQR